MQRSMRRKLLATLQLRRQAWADQSFRGIHFATSDLSGLALFEEAFYHGVRAAREVLHGRREP